MSKRSIRLQTIVAAFLLTGSSTAADSSGAVRRRDIQEEPAQQQAQSSWTSWLWSGFADISIGNRRLEDGSDDQGGKWDDTGAEVFMMTFSDEMTSRAKQGDVSVLDTLSSGITRVTKQNGINGNPWNRYVWSMVLDASDGLWIGTLNQSFKRENVPAMLLSVLRAPFGQKFDALVDALLRQWSGSPLFENKGAEIYYKSPSDTDFRLQLKTDTNTIGFRKMTTYNNNIYAGNTNGPDGPYDGAKYDFKFYEEGPGAKIFTNAGGNGFEILDDQGNLDSYDKSIRSLTESSYSRRLFIGTETYKCAKILIYNENASTSGGETWKKIDMDGDDCTHSVSQMYDLGGGKMLFGTWDTLGYGVYMLDETNGDTLTKLQTPQWFYHISCGVMEIRVFKGQLYVGVLSFIRGFALIRTSKIDDLANLTDDDWELISGNGFQKEQRQQLGGNIAGNEYTWTSAEANGIYFIGTVSLTPRGFSWTSGVSKSRKAQLWASLDGAEWKVVESEHFDASKFMYGFRTMAVTSDEKTLYLGSAVNMYLAD